MIHELLLIPHMAIYGIVLWSGRQGIVMCTNDITFYRGSDLVSWAINPNNPHPQQPKPTCPIDVPGITMTLLNPMHSSHQPQ